MILEDHQQQEQRWPQSGRHILAQFDADTLVVYQAYRPAIGLYALEHQRFGGPFSLERMSWIKPNFLWMMYRAGWGTKDGQQVILAVHLKRSAFDQILAQAVPSSFESQSFASQEAWQQAVRESDVRLQWDPDHAPGGTKLERRAIQLGLRGPVLRSYASEALVRIEDASALAAEQHENLRTGRPLQTPREDVYPVIDPTTRARLRLDSWPLSLGMD